MTSPVPEGTDGAVEAAGDALTAYYLGMGMPYVAGIPRPYGGAEVALAAAAPFIAANARQDIIRELEQANSALCDCRDSDSSVPTSPKTGAAMDHHCDCRAVVAASILFGANSLTRHAQECGHGTRFDKFYTPLDIDRAARAAGKDKIDDESR